VSTSWFQRLKAGLAKTTQRLGDGISGLFTGKKRLDQETLDELEEVLITADLGPATAARLTANLTAAKFEKEVEEAEIREAFAADIATILEPVAVPLAYRPDVKPHVILVVGVNGSGKTTTIGKLARVFRGEGHSVMLAAGDTFRAAAIEQLQIWGERVGAPVIAKTQGADAAALAFEALDAAIAAGTDILLIDTAGRLHNKTKLMAELEKVVRVLARKLPGAPHDVVLVLDATTGQNALSQVKIFRDLVKVTGLVLTKLDGTAKGGVVVALANEHKLPVHAVGVGESAEDLRPFTARDFARNLMGLE